MRPDAVAAAGPGSAPDRRIAVEARQVTKAFPGVVANDRVDFVLEEGEVHTVLGENGAGKSTLASILCGLYQPDSGELLRSGHPVRLRGPRDGLAHGIGMVHQHFRLVERFTVAENVVLGDPEQGHLLNAGVIEAKVAEIGERFGLPVDPRATIADLAMGQRQRVEIVKMLYRGADVLLLDEPTAVLTPAEADALFETVHSMAASGKAIVFISHKLGEVMAVSHRVTVMRGGRVTGEITGATSERQLAELMVGRPVDLVERRGSAPTDEVVLSARGLGLEDGGRSVLDGLDLDVRRGEILGVAGVAGNGQGELAEIVSGIRAPTSGTVEVGGRDVTGGGPVATRAAGLVYVPDDRLGTGLVPTLSLTDNLLLTRPRSFLVDRRSARAEARQAIEDYEIKAPGPDAEARVLSGGNAQKVLLARELAGLAMGDGDGPQVAVVSSPTRGLDVGAAEFVRGQLHEARERGGGVLLISEDLDEVRGLSDRIVVLYRGRVVLEGGSDELELEDIGLAMAGVAREEAS